MMILGFPSNPTAQCVDLEFSNGWGRSRRAHGIYIVHDLAYAISRSTPYKSPSIMQVPDAPRCRGRILHHEQELNNLAGWRIGSWWEPRPGQCAGTHKVITTTALSRRSRSRRSLLSRARRNVLKRSACNTSAARRARERPARGGLDGRGAEGIDVHSGPRSPSPTGSWSLESPKKVLEEAKSRCRRASGFGDYGDTHVRFRV